MTNHHRYTSKRKGKRFGCFILGRYIRSIPWFSRQPQLAQKGYTDTVMGKELRSLKCYLQASNQAGRIGHDGCFCVALHQKPPNLSVKETIHADREKGLSGLSLEDISDLSLFMLIDEGDAESQLF